VYFPNTEVRDILLIQKDLIGLLTYLMEIYSTYCLTLKFMN